MGLGRWFRSKKKLEPPHAAQPGGKKSSEDLDRQLLDENKKLRAQLLLQNEASVKQQPDVATGTSTREEQAIESGAGGFAVVLLDGDSDIFAKWYLRDGKAGGRRAAEDLSNKISGYLRENTVDGSPASVTAMSFMLV